MWLCEPFTRGQAWVDLIMLANHKEGYIRVRGVRYEVKRGQVGWSEVALAKRWKWSRGKVRRFLQELEENDSQIVQQKTNVTTLLSIVNYDKFQSNDTANRTASDTADGQQTVQQTDTNKNVKNDKNGKKYVVPTRKFGTKGFTDFYENEVATLTHTLTKNFLKEGCTEYEAKSKANEQISKDKEAYDKFMNWITANAPTVNQMPEPFTMAEFLFIRDQFDNKKVKDMILTMHNKEAYKKNRNANLTFKNWYRREHGEA